MISFYQKYKLALAKFLGKPVDFDWQYANQCVDWIKQYAKEIGYQITTTWNAKDYAINWLGKWWKIVVWMPWVWDIVVFPNGQYGHIAVVQSIKWNQLIVVDQNADGRAYLNNNAKNLGSFVKYSTYNLRWNEVYFRAN